MGKVVNLDDFRKSNELEDEYLKFLSHVNKFVKIPTNIPELSRAFYFILRYLEGTINCFEILSVIKNLPQDEVSQLRQHLTAYLEGLSDDLQKY